MEGLARRRLVLAGSALVLVIALMALTAVVALQATRRSVDEAAQIDRRLVRVDQLRSTTRALARSARRYMMSGDLEEQQRVLAIVHDLRRQREVLGARASLAKGAMLEADIEDLVAGVTNAMTFEDTDPIVRLSRFEDELVRVQNPLAMTFDDIVSRERARRDALRSADTLARAAQWAVGVAGVMGVVLVLAGLFALARRRRREVASSDTALTSDTALPTEPSLLR